MTILAVVVVLCVTVTTLFLFLSSQTGGEPTISFETVPPEEVPEIVDAALTPPDPSVPPDQTPDLSGAVVGDVAIVWSLTDDTPRFSLVPLTRNGSAVAIAKVFPGGSAAASWILNTADLTTWRRPSLADAKNALRDAGYRDGNWTARWVELNAEQPIGPYFWEFRKETGESVYVGYDRYDDLIRVYTMVTPKTKGGGQISEQTPTP